MKDQTELLPFDHIPIVPPRAGIPGECIYLNLWREYLDARPDEWDCIFNDLNFDLDQRAVSVAASFMVWMGCNNGRDFTQAAEDLYRSNSLHSKERAFLAAWAINNRRQRGINSGLRTVEYMLAPACPVQNGWAIGGLIPEVSQRDTDVLECMVVMWSGITGMRFRSIALPMIEAANQKERSRLFSPDPKQAVRQGDD